MPSYRTLVIAPRIISIPTPDGVISAEGLDLPNAEAEIAAIVSALGASYMPGDVSLNDVIGEMQKGWDIIWFISHGDERGIWLSREIATASQLIQGIRSSKAKLIVINTCSSYEVAAAIHSELRTYLIATLKPVYDQDAFTTGRLLAAYLGRGDSFPVAFNEAIPGRNTNYVYLPGKEERAIPPPPTQNRGSLVDRYSESATRLEDLVGKINLVLYGIPDFPGSGLIQASSAFEKRASSLEKALASAESEIADLRKELESAKKWLLLVSVIVVCLVVIVGAYQAWGNA